MSKYVAADFWAEVDRYYKAKAPYTELLMSAAAREPSENDKAEEPLPEPDIFSGKHGWTHQRGSKDGQEASEDESLCKDLQDLKVDDSKGKQKATVTDKSDM